MKKVILSIIVLSIVMTSCVSQKKYAELQKKYNEAVLNSANEVANLRADIDMRTRVLRRANAHARAVHTEKQLLERELQKHIRTEKCFSLDSVNCLGDGIDAYSFYAIDMAHSAIEAMVAAHTKVQDSIISVCQSIQLETIDRYIQSVNMEYDSATIYTEPDWQGAMQYCCSDLWADGVGAYWAVEVQKVDWKKFADIYVARIVEEELVRDELIASLNKQFEGKDPNDYQGDRLYFKDDKIRPKLKQDLFREILNIVVDEKIKLRTE